MASPEEMAALTSQFKHNTDELQSYLRDLDQWQDEMHKKDEMLRSASRANKELKTGNRTENSDTLPAKRKVEKSEEKSKLDTKKPKEQRISGYDYDRWDKFDVDKALDDIEQANKSDSKKNVDTIEEQLLKEQKAQEAIMFKDKGNDYYKAGKYDQAITCYTKGIECDPKNALLPANRAMAFLKKGDFKGAEKDCDVALSIDPTYVKALQRRGTSRWKQSKLQGALQDFNKVLSIEPGNKQAQDDASKIQSKLKDSSPGLKDHEIKAGQQKKIFSSNEAMETLEPGQILPIFKPPHQRSKKPLQKIEVVDTDNLEKDIQNYLTGKTMLNISS